MCQSPNSFEESVALVILFLFGDEILQLKCTKHIILCHRENGGTLGMVPLIINPIYTLYSGYLDAFIG